MRKFFKVGGNAKEQPTHYERARSLKNLDEDKKRHQQSFRRPLQDLIRTVLTRQRKMKLDASKEDLIDLDEFGFFESFRSCSNVELRIDMAEGKIFLKGTGEELNNAYNECSKVLHQMTRLAYVVNPPIWKVIADSDGQKHLMEIMDKKKIQAKVKPGNSTDTVVITALNRSDLEKAKLILFDSVVQHKISVPVDVDVSLLNLEDFSSGKTLKISFFSSDRLIELTGLKPDVERAKKAIEVEIESTRMVEKKFQWQFSTEKWEFLNRNLTSTVKPIEEKLSHFKVSINLEYQHTLCSICVAGHADGLTECKKSLRDLFETIEEKDEEITVPGIGKFLAGKYGKEKLEAIERNLAVYIRIDSTPIPRTKTSPFPEKPTIYDLCSTIANGVKLSWTFGRIESERAEVLVYSAHSNINDYTACGRALKDCAGPTYVEKCKPHTNIAPWNIVCTPGGNLACSYVIHAVCCDWNDKEKEKSQKALSELIKKIFQKCVELRVSSVALPTIGAGQHRFPEDVVLRIIRDEFIKCCSVNNCQFLKEVRLIIFEEKRSKSRNNYQRSHSSFSPHPPPHSPLLPSPPPPFLLSRRPDRLDNPDNFPSATSGNVTVFIKKGDVTKDHKADALINVLPISLQLAGGGGVCKSILKNGGKTIQDELNQHRGNCTPGSVVLTSPGSLKNVKKIIHFVPKTTELWDLKVSLEQCFSLAQQHSLSDILVPAIGTASLNVAPKSCAELILNAAKNIASANYCFRLYIVVFLKKMLPDFKTAVNDAKKDLEAAFASQYPITFGATDRVVLRYVGFGKNIDDAVLEVKEFLDGEKERKTMRWKNIEEFLQTVLPELESRCALYCVQFHCLSSEEAAVEGLKGNVYEFLLNFIHLLSKTVNVPSCWSDESQKGNVHVNLVSLEPSSSEYQEILGHFNKTGGRKVKVKTIERIENRRLYTLYQAQKTTMQGKENEKRLFHGTNIENIEAINLNNFNRGYAGINATKYGAGVYFARDASYSLRYCSSSKNLFKIYVVKVLVGDFTLGRHDMKAPPSKNDPNNSGLLYDSVVDNVSDPSIFVIFQDHQFYPEYLISFTK